MAKTKIYVSFDFDNDRDLKNQVVGAAQKPSTNFKIANWSMKLTKPENKWMKESKFRITRCDVLVVLTGENTVNSDVVKREVEIANGAKMKIIQLKAHPQYQDVEGAGEAHDFTEEKLAELLSKQDLT